MNETAGQDTVCVHLGYFEGFKSNDTLLMEGDDEGLRLLVSELRSLEAGVASHVWIDGLPFVRTRENLRLLATRERRDRLVRVSSTEFSWESSESGWGEAADKVEALFLVVAGHQYFETASGSFIIQVSKGEYGAEWWGKNSH